MVIITHEKERPFGRINRALESGQKKRENTAAQAQARRGKKCAFHCPRRRLTQFSPERQRSLKDFERGPRGRRDAAVPAINNAIKARLSISARRETGEA